MWIFTGSGLRSHSSTLVAKPGVQQEHVARLDHDAVGRHDLLERRPVDPSPLVAEMVGQVDEHPPPLHAVPRHVLEPEVVGERPVRPAVAPGVGLGTDQVDAGAVAVVVHGLFDPVAVGVELGADVGERVPLRRVLQRERDDVVGPDVDVLGVAEVLHLAHVDVVEGGRLALHVLGRGDHRRVPALVERGAAGVVERQAQAEADAGFDLADALEHLLGGDQVDPAQFVVVAPVAPGRAGRALLPPLRHASRSLLVALPCTDRLV